jgi:hypothetical protein
MKVSVKKSYYNNTVINSVEYDITTPNTSLLFDNLIASAQYLAHLTKGTIKVDRTEDSLYIAYNLPGHSIIDCQYVVKK